MIRAAAAEAALLTMPLHVHMDADATAYMHIREMQVAARNPLACCTAMIC
jgi:hypothetical protein